MFALKARVVLASILALLSLPAEAQLTPTPSFEFWGSSEFQMTLSPETDPNLAWHDIIPDRFRIYTEHQFAHDLGLQQTLWRMGPIWNLLPFLTVAMHVTSSSFPSSSSSAFNQEVRLELEPTFKGEFLPELRWSNRHRIELRLRPNEQFWRYRTRFALNYHIPDSPLTPFVSNEFHFVSNGAGFSQNRAQLGLSYQLTDSTQISLSYLSRLVHASSNSPWVAENGLWLSVFYSSREDGLFQMQAD